MDQYEWDRTLQQAHAVGEALGVQRDYRKECWIAVYAACLQSGNTHPEARVEAGRAVDNFDATDFS